MIFYTGSPSSKYEHRRASALLRNIQNTRICMGKKTYRFRNPRKWKDFNIKQLTLLKMCVASLLCCPRADLWPFYGFLRQRFSLYIKVPLYISSLDYLCFLLRLLRSLCSVFKICNFWVYFKRRSVSLALSSKRLNFLPASGDFRFSLSEKAPFKFCDSFAINHKVCLKILSVCNNRAQQDAQNDQIQPRNIHLYENQHMKGYKCYKLPSSIQRLHLLEMTRIHARWCRTRNSSKRSRNRWSFCSSSPIASRMKIE